ncbi:LAME_0G02872g1_1 [Lachancea meyersii CBS 8951]|uniref:Diphthamide biosynthesis protein 4 n=1 Tax=Lachancea meyersii CBS 8951 TaxID=1266667 RepID=A0A1G4K695_9SACH|nr:LAME_0G02872g1_1 [Lachancea meyersii CBS 8951]
MVLEASHYEILGLEANCDLLEVKKAYKDKLLSSHPDKSLNREQRQEIIGTGSKTSIEKIKQAYRVLSDAKSRANYDILLAESYKKHGFHNSGEGLDSYSLDEFKHDEDTAAFCMSCPRCLAPDSFEFTEDMLEENGLENPSGGFLIVVQCSACSLWLTVTFDIAEED